MRLTMVGKTIVSLGLLFIVFLLAACNPASTSNQPDLPTLDINAIKDEVRKTVVSQITQEAALSPTEEPTNTPEPTAVPTELPTAMPTETPLPTAAPTASIQPTATSGDTSAFCLVASLVADVTVPNGTVFSPGTTFTKTWRIYNNGNCRWDNDFKIIFVSGDDLGGPASTSFNAGTVLPGASADLSLNLTAPSSAGNYTGYWMLQTDMGEMFGLGSSDKPLSLSITVE